MARGGKRSGAGRKPILDWTDRLYLGGTCENKFRGLWEKAWNEAWEGKDSVKQVRAIQTELRTATRENGPGFFTSAEGRELREEVEEAIREIRRTPNFVDHPNRLFTLTAPRPKGVKPGICEAVAFEFSEKWRVNLSPRFVRSCWDDFRAFEKETRPAD